MIHVIASIELKPGTRNTFLAEFRKLVPLVLSEDGCIEYGPSIDVDSGIGAQLPNRVDHVTVVEKWASLVHLKAHLIAPHMTPYREAVRDIVVLTQLQVLEPA